MAIKRVWHGWTRPDNADAYLEVLRREVVPGIEAKGIPGFRSFEAMRRNHGDEVEFITTMTFDSIQNVIDFQGADYKRAYVPEVAQAVLERWDATAQHFEVVESRSYPADGLSPRDE